jgi:hypothetical protein
MTNTAKRTYLVGVIERAITYYEVEAEDARTAAENWQDGEFHDRDDEALDTEGPCNVREKQPDGKWTILPGSEWEAAPPAAVAVHAPGTRAHTPEPWDYDQDTGRIYRADGDVEPTIAWVELENTAADQSKADGHLLAAAPRLLAACRMVVERWERGDLAEAARACSAAIKAAGVAPSSPAANDTAKKPYSVLLRYPDDANDGGNETYYIWVQASNPTAAVADAQREALATNEWTDRDPADFVPLLVTEGHHYGQ